MVQTTPRLLAASRRVERAPASPIRKLAPSAEAARQRGLHVYHLNIGQPDFATPAPILDAIRAFDQQVIAYAPSPGLPETRRAWSAYYAAHGLTVDERQVLVTVGGSEALQLAIAAAADPGDNLLVFEPTYTNYCGFAATVSVELKAVPLDPAARYALPPFEVIDAAIDARTRAILICNPNNPTGSVYDRATMQSFVDLAERRGLFLIVDEVYREFVYDGLTHTSILQIAPQSPNVIMIDSVSKRFNACGVRIGSLVTPNEAVFQGALRLAQARLSAPTVEQLAVNALLHAPLAYTEPLVAEYARRRDAALLHLRAIPGAQFSEPQGAFYTVLRLPVDDSERFARWLLEDFEVDGETVFVAPMPGFYVSPGKGQQEVRLAFVLDSERLARATALLGAGVERYLKQ